MYAYIIHYHINKLDILPFLSWRKDRSRPASSSMLLCRMDMPIEKMNLNCSKLEMIAGGGPAAARPPVPVTSPSPSQLKSARVCTLSHNITQFERRKGTGSESGCIQADNLWQTICRRPSHWHCPRPNGPTRARRDRGTASGTVTVAPG